MGIVVDLEPLIERLSRVEPTENGTIRQATIREAFAEEAEACAERGSPFTGRLCEALARILDRSTHVGRRVLDWPGQPDARGDSVPLRLVGGLHALVRQGSLPGLRRLYPPHPLPDLQVLEKALAEVLPTADSCLLPGSTCPRRQTSPCAQLHSWPASS